MCVAKCNTHPDQTKQLVVFIEVGLCTSTHSLKLLAPALGHPVMSANVIEIVLLYYLEPSRFQPIKRHAGNQDDISTATVST